MRTCPISARSPRRSGDLVFDVNDFDETLPGPFEWDVKRLAASLAVAGRDNGFPAKACRKIALAAAEGYRTAMRGFADQTFWTSGTRTWTSSRPSAEFRSQVKAKRFKEGQKLLAKAHTSDSMKALGKLTTMVDGQRRIISHPPMIVPVEEVFADAQADAIYQLLHTVLGKYRRTLQSDRRHLLEQFTMVQVARKVVGVGSVGTRAWVLLMDAVRRRRAAVPAGQGGPAVGPGGVRRAQPVHQPGRARRGRAAPDAGRKRHLPRLDPRPQPPDGVDRDFYVRQLKDWKFSVPIEAMVPTGMTVYARLCGWTLARAHARSGDRIALAAYLGGSAKFDEAIADFAETYADQNERDYAALQAAVKEGKVEAATEI